MPAPVSTVETTTPAMMTPEKSASFGANDGSFLPGEDADWVATTFDP